MTPAAQLLCSSAAAEMWLGPLCPVCWHTAQRLWPQADGKATGFSACLCCSPPAHLPFCMHSLRPNGEPLMSGTLRFQDSCLTPNRMEHCQLHATAAVCAIRCVPASADECAQGGRSASRFRFRRGTEAERQSHSQRFSSMNEQSVSKGLHNGVSETCTQGVATWEENNDFLSSFRTMTSLVWEQMQP